MTMLDNPKAAFLVKVCEGLPETPCIVEIGCVRTLKEDPTDGWSSVYLSRYADKLYSVDIDGKALDVARKLVSRHGRCNHILFQEDGADFLKTWDYGKIDLLLLDSSNDPIDTLKQANYALPHMQQGGIIIIDDVQPIGHNWFGKGSYAMPFLIQRGWKCLIEPTLWQGDNCWAMAQLWQ